MKLAIEYVLGILVVNAYIIYKINNKSNIGVSLQSVDYQLLAS